MHFLSLSNEILYNIFKYYLADETINPVYSLLICTKLTKIISGNNFCGFLKKNYIGDSLLKKVYTRILVEKIGSKYYSSFYWSCHIYCHYSDNLLSFWNLTPCDNLLVKHETKMVNKNIDQILYCLGDTDLIDRIAVIYHKKQKLSKEEISKIAKTISNNFRWFEETILHKEVGDEDSKTILFENKEKGQTRNVINKKTQKYKHMTLICFYKHSQHQYAISKLKLNKERYKKNIDTLIKFGKPLGYKNYACIACIDAATKTSDSEDLIFCTHLAESNIESGRELIENNVIKKILEFRTFVNVDHIMTSKCEFFEQILSYNYSLYTLVGREYTHKIIKAIITNLTPKYHYVCLSRMILDFSPLYHNLVLTNVIYKEICRFHATSKRQKRKKCPTITYEKFKKLLLLFSNVIESRYGIYHHVDLSTFDELILQFSNIIESDCELIQYKKILMPREKGQEQQTIHDDFII